MSDKPEKRPSPLTRREFFRLGGAAGVGYLAAGVPGSAHAEPKSTSIPIPDTMPTRNLGRTGHRTGIFSLGGQSALEKADNEARAVPIIDRAIDLGVNYIDTAAMYGRERRWSQRYIGQVMKRRRNEVFLATKTHDRTRDGSKRLLEESLRLLQTDRLDAWQIHNLSRMEQVDQIFAKGGAMEALLEAREAGVVRHLGVTGHADPEVLMEAMRRFEFDTLLLALNAADPHHRGFGAQLLPMAVERQMGIIGMKIPARGRILASWDPPPPEQQRRWDRGSTRGTLTMREAFDYVLSQPVSTVIIGCDTIEQLEENVSLARSFTPLSGTQLAALNEKTESIARQALFFRRWG